MRKFKYLYPTVFGELELDILQTRITRQRGQYRSSTKVKTEGPSENLHSGCWNYSLAHCQLIRLMYYTSRQEMVLPFSRGNEPEETIHTNMLGVQLKISMPTNCLMHHLPVDQPHIGTQSSNQLFSALFLTTNGQTSYTRHLRKASNTRDQN